MQVGNQKVNAKLPTIAWPEFSGDPLSSWQGFGNQYQASIHNNYYISDID